MIVELIWAVALHPSEHASRSSEREPLHALRPAAHDWTEVAECESSGDWHANTGNGYYGGTQIAQPTWEAFGGLAFAPRADLASKDQQVTVSERILAAQGPGAWPVCHVYLRAA